MSFFTLEENCDLELVQGPLNEQDLNLFLGVKSPYTYIFRMKSDSMHEFGILKNDVVICSRAKIVEDGDIIIMALNGRFVLRKYIDGKEPYLMSSDGTTPLCGKDIELFGVVVGIVRKGDRTINSLRADIKR